MVDLSQMDLDIDKDLVSIIFRELGKRSADLFVQFYQGSPIEEQVQGARELLNTIVGELRTSKLLKNFSENETN